MKKGELYALILMVVLALSLGRFTLPSHGINHDDFFKDAAHLIVGALIGAWVAVGVIKKDWNNPLLWSWVVLIVVELVAVSKLFLK